MSRVAATFDIVSINKLNLLSLGIDYLLIYHYYS